MTSFEEARLRATLRQTERELHHAETELATRMAEIREFDAKIESRIGTLETELEILETEIRSLQTQIRQIQQAQAFPDWIDYSKRIDPNRPPEQRTTRVTTSSPSPESELRALYRDLARRYHPDTAFDDLDRTYRTEMMMRINEAYANRDVGSLRKLARGMVNVPVSNQPKEPPTRHLSSLEKLVAELTNCQTKLQETRGKIEQLRFHPSVQLSLNVKLGWREGRDVIGEMAETLKKKVAQKTHERDALQVELREM